MADDRNALMAQAAAGPDGLNAYKTAQAEQATRQASIISQMQQVAAARGLTGDQAGAFVTDATAGERAGAGRLSEYAAAYGADLNARAARGQQYGLMVNQARGLIGDQAASATKLIDAQTAGRLAEIAAQRGLAEATGATQLARDKLSLESMLAQQKYQLAKDAAAADKAKAPTPLTVAQIRAQAAPVAQQQLSDKAMYTAADAQRAQDQYDIIAKGRLPAVPSTPKPPAAMMAGETAAQYRADIANWQNQLTRADRAGDKAAVKRLQSYIATAKERIPTLEAQDESAFTAAIQAGAPARAAASAAAAPAVANRQLHLANQLPIMAATGKAATQAAADYTDPQAMISAMMDTIGQQAAVAPDLYDPSRVYEALYTGYAPGQSAGDYQAALAGQPSLAEQAKADTAAARQDYTDTKTATKDAETAHIEQLQADFAKNAPVPGKDLVPIAKAANMNPDDAYDVIVNQPAFAQWLQKWNDSGVYSVDKWADGLKGDDKTAFDSVSATLRPLMKAMVN